MYTCRVHLFKSFQLQKVLGHPRVFSTSAPAAKSMSRQVEKKDFGPSGFKWLTLKRIVVCKTMHLTY